MKIKIMTSDAINYIKANIDTLKSHYINRDDPEIWIKKALNKEAFVEVPELEFEDFELFVDEEHPSSTDVANIKLLFIKMSSINDSFATDERLWAGLSHTLFYGYMGKRWPNDDDSKSILNHYFFNGGRPRCYMVNTMARLWWLGKKTINLTGKNPFRILDYIQHDINGYSFTLFGSNWSNSERTLNLFFDAIYEYTEETGERVGRQLFNDVMQYTNGLCGIYIIDACDDDFIRTIIKEYLIQRDKEIDEEKLFNKVHNVRTTGIERLDNIIRALNSIGGHGKLYDILSAYENITQTPITQATKDYIINQLKYNSPDFSDYSGNPIFYRLHINNDHIWKIANDYLVVDNLPIRKRLMDEQIAFTMLTPKELPIFNTICAMKSSTFSSEDLQQYKQAIINVFPEITDFDNSVKETLKSLRNKGMLELIGKNNYKKSYAIKVN